MNISVTANYNIVTRYSASLLFILTRFVYALFMLVYSRGEIRWRKTCFCVSSYYLRLET